MKALIKGELKTKHFRRQASLKVGKTLFRKRLKVKLDHRTTIIINKLSSLAVWKKLFPKAHIIK